jgi:predicted acylesterase/phospholipase RssA
MADRVESSSESSDSVTREIRLAGVFYGGASLAIYEHGVAQEMLRLVRATAPGVTLPDTGTEKIYRQVAEYLGCNGNGANAEIQASPNRFVRFTIDILSGTSAGGINALFLAHALANGQNLDDLHNLWLREADLVSLLNDKRSLQQTRLKLSQPPASVLNSERMYLLLYRALTNMDAQAKSTCLASNLDLYVTATDLNGLSVPIRLSFQEAQEHRFRFAFHFQHDDAQADFTAQNRPLLAFAARCTSAFPVAFEPMCLKDIDAILASEDPSARTSQDDDWDRFFTIYNNHNIDYRGRYFADGGYLHNKPFSYAVDELLTRRADRPVQRTLIYVDPFPELPENNGCSLPRPDAVTNLLDATTKLPRYQTIREEIGRVLKHNELVHRTRRILEHAGSNVRKPDGSYYWLRVSQVTDDVARMASRALGFEDEAMEALAIRAIVRAWRECFYGHELEADVAGEGTESRPGLCKFLAHFDIGFKIRRLDHVLLRIDELGQKNPELQEGLNALRAPYSAAADCLCKTQSNLLCYGDANPLREVLDKNLLDNAKGEGRRDRLHHLFKIQHCDLMEILDLNCEGLGKPCSLDAASLRALAVLGDCNGEGMAAMERIAAFLREQIVESVAESKERYKTKHDKRSQDEIEKAVAEYYEHFEACDSVLFPITFGVELGEGTPVELVRISPIDTKRYKANRSSPKLMGETLGAFGGFLASPWRVNDMLWGRIDAAEQLITAMLPDSSAKERRNEFIDKACWEILGQELPEFMSAAVAPGGLQSRCQQILDRFGESVPPELDPESSIRLISRSTRIIGGVLQNIADAQSTGKALARSLARFATMFWGIVEIATPRSIPEILARYVIQLLYVFEFLLIFASQIMASGRGLATFGWTALGITLAAHLIVSGLRKYMLRRSVWAALGLLLFVALALFVCWRGSIVTVNLWTTVTPYITDRLRRTTSTAYDPLVLVTPVLMSMVVLVGAFITSTSQRLMFFQERKIVNGIRSPMLAMEVPQQREDVKFITGPHGSADRELMAGLQDWDRGFIVLYSLTFIAIACIPLRGSVEWQRVIAVVSIVLALLTAVADWREDKCIDHVLGLTDLSYEDVAKLRSAGLQKWAFLALTLCSLAVIVPIIGWGSLIVQIPSMVSAGALGIAAVGILVGVLKARWRNFIEKSSSWFAVALLLVIVMFVFFPDKLK